MFYLRYSRPVLSLGLSPLCVYSAPSLGCLVVVGCMCCPFLAVALFSFSPSLFHSPGQETPKSRLPLFSLCIILAYYYLTWITPQVPCTSWIARWANPCQLLSFLSQIELQLIVHTQLPFMSVVCIAMRPGYVALYVVSMWLYMCVCVSVCMCAVLRFNWLVLPRFPNHMNEQSHYWLLIHSPKWLST